MENQYFLRKKKKHTQDINNQISDNSNIIINKESNKNKCLLKNLTLEKDESYKFWENYLIKNIKNQRKINKSDLTKFETFLSKDYTNENINYLYLKFLLFNFNSINSIKSIDLIQLIFNKLEVTLSDEKLNELEKIKNDKKIKLDENNYFPSDPNYIINLLISILKKENLTEKNAEFKIKFNSYGIPIGFSNNQNLILRYYYYSIYCNIYVYIDNFKQFIRDILNILKNKKEINIIDIECISVFLFYLNEIYANKISIEFSYYFEYFENLIKEDKKIEPNFNYLNSSENELIFFDNKIEIKNKISNNLNIKEKESVIKNIEKNITNNFIYYNCDDDLLILNLLNDIKNYNIYNILLHKIISFKNIENCKNLYYSYKNSTFNDYLYEFKNLLKNLSKSNLFKKVISFESTFKKNLNIYNNEFFNDIIENRLVFLPISIPKYYGVTDKNLLKIYLNNLQNTVFLDYFYNIFNIGNNSASFIHENFHFLFIYNFYFNNINKQNINYDFKKFEDDEYFTDDENLSFEFDTLLVCKNTEKYLKKFQSILSKEELNDLDKIEECSKKEKLKRKEINENKYFKFINNFLTFMKNNNNKIKGDCGRKFDIILFSDEKGQIKNNVNLLQIIMLIDEQSYNLHPFSFKYIFNELGKEDGSFKFFKQNFKGNLINKIYENGLKYYLIDENIINKNLNLKCSIFKSQKVINKRKNNIIKFVKEDGQEYDMINLEMNDFKCDLFKDTMY